MLEHNDVLEYNDVLEDSGVLEHSDLELSRLRLSRSKAEQK